MSRFVSYPDLPVTFYITPRTKSLHNLLSVGRGTRTNLLRFINRFKILQKIMSHTLPIVKTNQNKMTQGTGS